MTRRISLPLAASTTDTHCMDCPAYEWGTDPDEITYYHCGAFDKPLEAVLVPMRAPLRGMRIRGVRLLECVQAEREHAAMVEAPSAAYRRALWMVAIGCEWCCYQSQCTEHSLADVWYGWLRDKALRSLASLGDSDAQRMIGGGS